MLPKCPSCTWGDPGRPLMHEPLDHQTDQSPCHKRHLYRSVQPFLYCARFVTSRHRLCALTMLTLFYLEPFRKKHLKTKKYRTSLPVLLPLYSSILQFTYTPLAAPLALIKNRIDFKIPNITFRTLHSSQPQPAYLRSSLHVCHSTRSLRLSNSNLLSAAFVRTSFGARSFSVAAPKIWNSLPVSLRTCTSPDTFRRHLKTHYCQQAFQST